MPTITDFTLDDVTLLMDYWFDSPEVDIAKMGVKRSGLATREVFSASLSNKITLNAELSDSKLHYLAIRFQDRTIGTHSLSSIVDGESAVFHAHIFEKNMRGKGLGKLTYPLALKIFFKRFNFQSVEFHTPVLNIAANQVKASLGIPLQERFVQNKPHLLPDLETNRYILTRKKFDEIFP